MTNDRGAKLIAGLERRFGGLALPGILRWVAIFQAMSWGLMLFSEDFLQWIAFDRGAILSGQVWRLFTWALEPMHSHPILVLIVLFLFFFINDGLEGQWGPFRLNLYVLSSIAVLALVSMAPIFAPYSGQMGWLFFSTVFLAFASLFPNQIIHMFLVIPMKAKWLGWLKAGFVAAFVLGGGAIIVKALFAIAGLGVYLAVFVPAFLAGAKQRSATAVRRHRFEEAKTADGEPFHQCEACEANDQSDPELAFRVSADGRELCERCLPGKES